MGYAEYLKALLQPLQVYALEEGFGAAELEALGAALDGPDGEGQELERESRSETAENWGLEKWEALLPYRPAAKNAAGRRAALRALLGIPRDGFTLQQLQEAACGCGLEVLLEETADKKAIRLKFPKVRGVPENMTALDRRIRAILPCHLEIMYVYSYFTWADLEASFPSWAMLEAKAEKWSSLEVYMEEEAE